MHVLSYYFIMFGPAVPYVLAQIKYAVYYDPEEEVDRNPRGAGWEPVPPHRWGEVSKESYETDFFNWDTIGRADINYRRNRCKNNTALTMETWGVDAKNPFKNNGRHKQNPVVLQKAETCHDKHGLQDEDHGRCSPEHVTFIPNPYSLHARFKECGADLDISHSKARWYFEYLEIKSPSEHVYKIDDGTTWEDSSQPPQEGKGFKRYNGEIVLYNRGKEQYDDLILAISVLLDAQEEFVDMPELETYIVGFEKQQKLQYDRCGVMFDKESCSLTRAELDTDGATKRNAPEQEGSNEHVDNKPSDRFLRARNDEASVAERLDDVERNMQEEEKETHYKPYRLYKKVETDKYYNIEGTLTHPPCYNGVEWRIFKKPLKISKRQMERIDDLIAQYINENCELGTVGAKRNDGTCHVNVNRPLQYGSYRHDMKDCTSWSSDDRA